MKKLLLLLSFLYIAAAFGQKNIDPIIVIDSKKMGFMNDYKKEMEALNPNDIATVTVFKDSVVSKKYGSEKGVIIITTKKYILETFYREFIEKSPLKENIPTIGILSEIGVISGNSKNKNEPYDELSKYVDTNTFNTKILKVAKITFIKPKDSIKINEKWVDGAIEISSIPGE
jgi:hypothetical protein